MGIWLPSRRVAQPQGICGVNSSIWPGKFQVFNPAFLGQILGTNSAITTANPSAPFSGLTAQGISLGYRPNIYTVTGECFTWDTGDFDVGASASMIFVGSGTAFSSYSTGVNYGGLYWGLAIKLTSSSVVASYVDNPTTAQYDATISGLSLTDGVIYAVGLTKNGNTVKAFFQGKSASASGGNGGIRRSPGYGLGYNYSAFSFYGHTVLAAISSVALSDAAMQHILWNPWQIFDDGVLYIPSASGALYPTLSNIRFAPATSTGGTFAVDLS